MSIEAIVHVLKRSKSRLGDRLVMIAIADNANCDTFEAWPAVKTIASKCAMSERQVQRAIVKLQEIGELCVKLGAGPHGCNIYKILVGGDNLSGVTNPAEGGDKSDKKVAKMSPEPSLEPSNIKPAKGKARVGSDENPIPNREQLVARFTELADKIPPEVKAQWNPDFEAEQFIAHFNSNGWRVGGKTPMLSWEDACVTWRGRFVSDQLAERRRRLQMPPNKVLEALEEAIANHICNPKHPRHHLAKNRNEITDEHRKGYADLQEKLKRQKDKIIANV